MKRIGIEPRWRPSSLGDKFLVLFFRLIHLLVYAPMRLITRLLGWSKIDWILLDLLSLPGLILRGLGGLLGARGRAWARRVNALANLYLVCRLCPKKRQALRDPSGSGVCAWNAHWNAGQLDIPSSFGPRNWLTQYLGRTALSEFQELAKEAPAEVHQPRTDRRRAWTTVARWIGSVVLLLSVAACALVFPFCHSYLCDTAQVGSAGDWRNLGPVPGAEQKHKPQGLTLVGDTLVFSNHWSDKKSGLYRFERDTMKLIDQAVMPDEATHTSGLAWDGRTLWAVDYKTTKLYQLDLQRTFSSGRAVVLAEYPTGIRRASAITVVTVDKVQYLVVSAFMSSSRTYFIDLRKMHLLESKSLRKAAYVSYRNGGFSQGLTWDGRYLYESINTRGDDRIDVYHVISALREGDGDKVSRLGSFMAPGPSVEDLATDGKRLWTSDEITFRFYLLPDLSRPLTALRKRNR